MSIQTAIGVTINTLHEMRRNQEKIACLTAYDAAFAKLIDEANIDVILVGDSLGMIVQGHNSTVPVSMDDMLYHTACVTSTARRALVIADMPFMSYTDIDTALHNATRLMQISGAHMVKLEATERQTEIVNELSACGIPVCAHLGLRPQHVHKLGGYKIQGKDKSAAQDILQTSQALEQAGADLLLVECIPEELAAEITHQVSIPVIGIGAGASCDGQILVLHDILGVTPGKIPSFSKNYMQSSDSIDAAVSAYIREVKSGLFPDN